MDKKEYGYAELSAEELEKVRTLEQKISEEKNEDVILIAYEDEQ